MGISEQSTSHYSSLGVERNASEDEIRSAYKKLAMKYHPDRNTPDPNLPEDENKFYRSEREEATRMFQKVSEAYAVLSDPDKRALYNASSRHSRPRISRRNSTMLNSFTSNTIFTDQLSHRIDPLEIFRRVCGQQSFANISQTASFSQPRCREQPSRSSRRRDSHPDINPINECVISRSNSKSTDQKAMPPIEIQLEITLEEFYYGCSKTALVSRKRFNEESIFETENFQLEVEIQPGWKHGTRLTYEGFGDEDCNRLPGDLVVILVELAHEMFIRKGTNLIVVKRVSLRQVMSETSFAVPTIDGNSVEVPNDCENLISPLTERRILYKGMPYSKNPTIFGDLIVKFEFVFPTKIDQETRDKIAELLNENDSEL